MLLALPVVLGPFPTLLLGTLMKTTEVSEKLLYKTEFMLHEAYLNNV
jgi:hypothetical protein